MSSSQKLLDIIPSRRQGFLDNIGVFGASDLLTSSHNHTNSSSQITAFYKPLVLVDGELTPLNDKLYNDFFIDLKNAAQTTSPKVELQ